jgi:potassium efflux system protein
VDTATLRAETNDRLKALDASAPPAVKASSSGTAGPNPSTGPVAGTPPSRPDREARTRARAVTADPAVDRSIRELLQERIVQLDEYDKVSAALHQANQTEQSAQRQAREAKDELERLERQVAQAEKAPETMLPHSFRGSTAEISADQASAMRDALDATTKEWKDWKQKIETLRSMIANWDRLQKARQTERDKLFERVTNMRAKTKEFETAVGDARTSSARRLAQERLVNLECESQVAAVRLQFLEAQIALEAKLADVRGLDVRIHRAHIQIAQRTLEQMRARYRVAAENQDRDLKQAAASEETKAQSSHDPLERFRARQSAELLVQEALALKCEQALATSPSPAPDEQRKLADRAEQDFAEIKGLLVDGRVSRLDAVRLNNDFRRIGPERDRLLKNEMATVEAQLQFYEDTLTGVELELIQDSLKNRFEQDLLRERVPPSRRAEGERLVRELERKHRAILVRRREALEKLSERAAQTLQQVARRLGILDEEYGFIRTHIFWVRDQDPIGIATLAQGVREFNYLLSGLLRLVEETVNADLWGRPSAEFLITALAVLALPVVLLRLRQGIWAVIQRDLSAPPP